MTQHSYEQHLHSIGIDPTTIVDEVGTLAIDPGALSPATLGELPRIALDEPSAEDAPPPELRLEDQLGEGGMGVVYSATQVPLRRRVAVKVLRNREAGAVEKGHLLREALITGTLEHPNIVPVHALGRTDDGRPMLVMKQIEGTPWRRSMSPLFAADVSLDTDRLEDELNVLIQVCHAVEFAHSRQIVHRDIKPDNVMIGAFGEVYLLDWGLAVSLGPGTGLPHVGQVRGLAGTPGYMAPEMAAGDRTIDARADLYQLGAVLHELITGRRRNAGRTVLDRLSAAHEVEPFAYDAAVPSDLAAICNRATARDPDDRYPDVAAFREALSVFIRHRGSLQLVEEARRCQESYEFALEGDSLRSTLRDPAVHNLATEARFGFRLALREWPDNRDARNGLQRLLERMIEYEFTRENRSAIASLLAELPEPNAGLERRYEALGHKLRERQAERRKLEKMRDETDLGVAARQRTRITFLLGVVLAIPIATLFTLRKLELHAAGYPDALGVMVLLGLATLWGRTSLRRLGGNRANLRLMDSIVALAVCLAALYAVGMLAQVPFEAMLAVSMLMGAGTSATLAITMERQFWPMPVGLLVAGLLVAVLPAYAGAFVAGGSLFAFSWASLIWHRLAKG